MSVREMLGLTPVFDAIFTEASISRAAARLGVTQSAVSQSLARMRVITEDELFEPTGKGVRPTPRAVAISKRLQSALTEVNEALSPKTPDIANVERTFVIDIGAGFDAILLSALYPLMAAQAPKVRLLVSNMRGADLLAELKFGRTEVAFDFQHSRTPDIRSELIATGPPVVIARPNHPKIELGLSRELYSHLSHASLVWNRSEAASGVASILAAHGIETRVAVSVPTVAALGALVSASDLIATTSDAVGKQLADLYGVSVYPVPFDFPNLNLYQLWHARHDLDAEHAWLRGCIKTLYL